MSSITPIFYLLPPITDGQSQQVNRVTNGEMIVYAVPRNGKYPQAIGTEKGIEYAKENYDTRIQDP